MVANSVQGQARLGPSPNPGPISEFRVCVMQVRHLFSSNAHEWPQGKKLNIIGAMPVLPGSPLGIILRVARLSVLPGYPVGIIDQLLPGCPVGTIAWDCPAVGRLRSQS